jgi:hypothetical protein
MSVLKWTGSDFRITKTLADQRLLRDWIKTEGAIVLEDAVKATRARWFFGRWRARQVLLKDAATVLRPGGRFATALKRELDELPKLVRQLGLVIRRKKHRDLYTVDGGIFLVVIPRAITQNELTNHLIDKLVKAQALSRFKGLPIRVLREISIEAEELFFEYISGGKQYLHRNGKAVILGADGEFGWQMRNVDGHYFCGYTKVEEHNLTKRGDWKDFNKRLKEVILGQTVHLKRLKSDKIQEIAAGFRSR